MNNRPVHAPLDPTKIKTIVDIGCGSGSMTLFLAQAFPKATVYGVDFSPISLESRAAGVKLGNVQWIQGNILDLAGKHPSLQPGTVDYSYSRLLAAGMKDWRQYIRAVSIICAPGGWIEMHDFLSQEWYDSENHIISKDWQWVKGLNAAVTRWGMDGWTEFRSAPFLLQEIEYEHVASKLYKLPFGPVPGKPEMDAIAKYWTSGLPDAHISTLPKVYPGDERMQQDMAVDIRKTMGCPTEGRWYPMLVVWGQKPAS